MTATTESGRSRAAALTPAQTAALVHVRSLAVAERRAALDTIVRELAAAGLHDRPEELLAAVVHVVARSTTTWRPAVSVVTEPERWTDRGSVAETLQHLKQLWHGSRPVRRAAHQSHPQ
ncbi:hypothetical protein ABZ777_14775 [Micromonospora parva]|uniref:hypothetical protein n=1 Tax=Micromonospora parva TaxID=1464048 RepID=UPI0033E8BCE7